MHFVMQNPTNQGEFEDKMQKMLTVALISYQLLGDTGEIRLWVGERSELDLIARVQSNDVCHHTSHAI